RGSLRRDVRQRLDARLRSARPRGGALLPRARQRRGPREGPPADRVRRRSGIRFVIIGLARRAVAPSRRYGTATRPILDLHFVELTRAKLDMALRRHWRA